MEPINFTEFKTNFYKYFEQAADHGAYQHIQKAQTGLFQIRPQKKGETFSGVRKITESTAGMHRSLSRIFDATASSRDKRRVFELKGKVAVLEFLEKT